MDAFFFYQAQWTTEPMAHITGRRYSPHPTGETELKVYSNCERVELLLNGKSLGINVHGELGVFRWPKVTLPAGENKIEAVGSRNGNTVRDTIALVCATDAPDQMGTDLLKP